MKNLNIKMENDILKFKYKFKLVLNNFTFYSVILIFDFCILNLR